MSVLFMSWMKQKIIRVLSRKDLLRASLNTNIDGTPVAVCMTRVPHVKPAHQNLLFLKLLTLCKIRSGFFASR